MRDDGTTPTVPESRDAETSLFAGWPGKTIDTGELGLISFDASGTAMVTQAQAAWLAARIASGELPMPAFDVQNSPGATLGRKKKSKIGMHSDE